MSIGAIYCLRPYNVESTSSHLITEVKPHLARLVLEWVEAWEYLMLQTLFLLRQILNLHFHYHRETVVSIGAIYCLGPYNVESTSSCLITEVKPHLAMLVLVWVNAWEYLVLQTFLLRQILNLHFHLSSGNSCVYRRNLLSATIQCAPVLVWSLKLSHIWPG